MSDKNRRLPEPGIARHDEQPGVSRDARERAEEIHEQRSERAQRVDERRSAKTTTDVERYADRPGQLDYPGVDSVEPDELHEQRSERAQRVDERRDAPIAGSKEQWAQSPQSFDWPGVDTTSRRSSESEPSARGLGLSSGDSVDGGDGFGIGDVFEASRQTFELEGGLLGESDTDRIFKL